MNPALIVQLVLAGIGIAEQVAPVFIHNPKSQKLETIIFTDINALFGISQQTALPPAPVATAPAPAPAPAVPAAQLATAHTQPLVSPGPAGIYPQK